MAHDGSWRVYIAYFVVEHLALTMMESGGFVHILGSLDVAAPLVSQDRAETLLKAAKVEKGLLEVWSQ